MNWVSRSVGQDVVGQNFVGQDFTGVISLGQEVSGAEVSGAGSRESPIFIFEIISNQRIDF